MKSNGICYHTEEKAWCLVLCNKAWCYVIYISWCYVIFLQSSRGVCPPIWLDYMDSHQETTTETWWLLHSNAESCTQHRLERPSHKIPTLRWPTTSLSKTERSKAPFCWTLLQKQRGTGERSTPLGTNPRQMLSWSPCTNLPEAAARWHRIPPRRPTNSHEWQNLLEKSGRLGPRRSLEPVR